MSKITNDGLKPGQAQDAL